MARFVGSMAFVYVHLGLLLLWLAVREGWGPLAPHHLSLSGLGSCASVEAIFLTAFVLITQNRMRAAADRRADLDLQISLLTEHEITRALSIVLAIAERLEVPVADDPELREFLADVAPERVLEQIERHEGGTGRPAP